MCGVLDRSEVLHVVLNNNLISTALRCTKSTCEDSNLVGRHVVSLDGCFPAFRMIVVPSPSEIKDYLLDRENKGTTI